jgi:protease I
MKALIISADNFEDTELLVPFYRLKEEGIDIDIASMKRGPFKGKHGYEVEAVKALDEVNSDDYDFLILPGGKAQRRSVRKDGHSTSRAIFSRRTSWWPPYVTARRH